MNLNLFYFLFFITASSVFSQVGINTQSPTASLDINGDLRIRTITEELVPDVAKDSVLVISRDGTVKSMPAKKVIKAAVPTAVKGSFSSGGLISLSLLSGSAVLPFDSEDFDENNEYDTSTYTFTAKQDGIYSVSTQIKASSTISVATNFGVRILHNGTVISRNSFANIGVTVVVTTINVTPPTRQTQTLVRLSEGDTITFELEGSGIGSLDIIGSDIDSQFTIYQIR